MAAPLLGLYNFCESLYTFQQCRCCLFAILYVPTLLAAYETSPGPQFVYVSEGLVPPSVLCRGLSGVGSAPRRRGWIV